MALEQQSNGSTGDNYTPQFEDPDLANPATSAAVSGGLHPTATPLQA